MDKRMKYRIGISLGVTISWLAGAFGYRFGIFPIVIGIIAGWYFAMLILLAFSQNYRMKKNEKINGAE